LNTPELGEAERQAIEAMVDAEVQSPQPKEEECQRYYEANPSQFMVGQALHVRHILFAVTPGVNVHALTVHAEKALLELTRKDAVPGRFAQLAAELSNCPTSEQGGDLGWIGPDDCAPELANELFHQKHSQWGMGVHPRLIHTRFGFHIIEVLERRAGKQPAYAEVRERIAALLSMQSRARALHQYMSLLVGEALVEGIDLEGADSPLVQ
jgi:peptidyl-prolyl cis-trans isomerase C